MNLNMIQVASCFVSSKWFSLIGLECSIFLFDHLQLNLQNIDFDRLNNLMNTNLTTYAKLVFIVLKISLDFMKIVENFVKKLFYVQ
jgi:hypothetical protein